MEQNLFVRIVKDLEILLTLHTNYSDKDQAICNVKVHTGLISVLET